MADAHRRTGKKLYPQEARRASPTLQTGTGHCPHPAWWNSMSPDPPSSDDGTTVTTLDSLLAAIPDDPQAAFVAADYLEEHSDPRAELLRLVYTLTRAFKVPGRTQME